MSSAQFARDSHAIRAEAAAWLARLRSEVRQAGDEAGFRAWLAEDTRHREAFDLVSAAWETAGGLAGTSASGGQARPVFSRRALAMGGAAALASIAGAGMWRLMSAGSYSTEIGEQRRIALEDGSTVILDTNTRIHVALAENRRSVDLLQGRAHFDVATDPLRPFQVRAGDRQVIAIGTAFDVARTADRVAVVLVEGKVAVRPVASSPGAATHVMSPGDRIVFGPARQAAEDHPDIAQVTAWQTGRAVFDDQTLAAAVAEMNRYTRRPIVVADASLATLRISGVYSTGDSEAFARSVAELLAVRVELTPGRIELYAAEEK